MTFPGWTSAPLCRAIAAITLAGGCSATSEPSPTIRLASGFYPLLVYNGRQVPYTVTELPTRDGHGSGCFLVFAAAGITLDALQGRWNYISEYQETCQGRVMSHLETPGTYRQVEDGLVFTIAASDTTFRYAGRVFHDRFEFYWGTSVLEFAGSRK